MIPVPDALVKSTFDLACRLQQVPSPTFHEERKAVLVREYFSGLGLSDVELDAGGNVLARIPGHSSQKPLVFSGHMDTVFPENFPLTLEIGEDRALGSGIGDNSLGLASLMMIPDLLQAAGLTPRHDVWLAATTCEEGLGDLKGIRAVASRFGSQPSAYISIEGMGLGNILHRGLGVERYRVSVKTPGGHSWVDYGLPSAIHELSSLAAQLTTIRVPKKPRTTFNIGIIHGGTSINTIASQAWMEIDLRSENPRSLNDLSNRVRQIVESGHKKDVQITMEAIGLRPSGEIPPTHPLVGLVAKVLKEIGLDSVLDIASTEANLPLSLGFPAVTIGVTIGDHAHSVQEYILTDPIAQGLAQIIGIIDQIWEGE
jgi:tripeptide aminopeptidase